MPGTNNLAYWVCSTLTQKALLKHFHFLHNLQMSTVNLECSIIPVWKGLPRTNNLAYWVCSTLTQKACLKEYCDHIQNTFILLQNGPNKLECCMIPVWKGSSLLGSFNLNYKRLTSKSPKATFKILSFSSYLTNKLNKLEYCIILIWKGFPRTNNLSFAHIFVRYEEN